jgi:hypothetical protein
MGETLSWLFDQGAVAAFGCRSRKPFYYFLLQVERSAVEINKKGKKINKETGGSSSSSHKFSHPFNSSAALLPFFSHFVINRWKFGTRERKREKMRIMM